MMLLKSTDCVVAKVGVDDMGRMLDIRTKATVDNVIHHPVTRDSDFTGPFRFRLPPRIT